jgi:hypothetical protein
MGLAGFSHDLEAIYDHHSEVREGFERLTTLPMSILDILVVLAGPVLPFLKSIPSTRNEVYTQIKQACGSLARKLLDNEASADDAANRSSIVGLLSKKLSFLFH